MNLQKNIYQIYNFSLYLFLFSLPVTEGIKQISLAIFIITGTYIAINERRKFEFDIINIGLLVFMAFTILSALVNSSPFKNVLDVTRCVIFFFVLRATGIGKINLKFAVLSLFVGFLVAFVMGCIVKFGSDNPTTLFKLKSIGHVNHSSIFMLLVFSVSLAFITQKDRFLRNFSIFVAVVSLVGIFITGSRATMYISPFVLIFTLGYFGFTKQMELGKISLIFIALVAIAATSVLITPDTRIISKVAQGVTANETRYPIFWSAFYTWQDNPIFGIGSGMFKSIDITHYFPGNLEVRVSHSHNTFLTFLTEKGIVALLGYLAFQIGLFLKFVKNIKSSVFVFLAFLVLGYQNVISLANTTFHHENALLMLFIWAAALAIIKLRTDPK
ncbi:O-antigen ligase family protein [Campylobacter mucosalis]|uniref:Putative membrane protein, putative O-glycosylation ligase n=1 Tax=Campylobacter mucosalis CCUG 21559 TaxID=1032067 RepID=A0A6G5QFR4_9BACT|nr:O-antigen ligase family protein [Campylobacter mucosalis]KEA45595.1 O-antigen ligase [Campylobacter mucosalis]QCD44491.1 putative membrane protein, putative O-glycosylation ligase [Campylobacter mucosalis CCUG 21559]QKF62457.1 O antigen ligase family membrane protein [Campylobacter mucosalis]